MIATVIMSDDLVTVLCQVFEANAGYKREFTLTNIDGEVFEEELSWGVESQIHVQPQHVAEATLMVDERRQTGSFVVETRMRGTVYVSFTSPRDNNAQVCKWLRDNIIKPSTFRFTLFHGRTRTAYVHRCVWSGITGR